MPKVQEEPKKSEPKSFESSEAQSSKLEKKSFESSAASSVEERERKAVASVKRPSSSLSIASIVMDEKEIPKSDKTDIPKSETAESNPAISGFLQPKTEETTKKSPVKEFFTHIVGRLRSSPPKKPPPKEESPVSEEYIPGQELLEDCIVQLPVKDKKTQTSSLKISTSPTKKAAFFLSPETYDSAEESTSQSTADERDLITPSPTPRLDASKMTLAIQGHEPPPPPKPEPGPFQKFKELIGLKKEEKPASPPKSHTPVMKGEHKTKATQTSTKITSLIATEGVEVLREFNRGYLPAISTSESLDYSESSQEISVTSTDSSSMNVDASATPPEMSSVAEQATTTFIGSDEPFHMRAKRLATAKEAFPQKMPNPLFKMLKHEDSEDVEDEAMSKSPIKKEPEDSPSKSRPAFHKQARVSESSSISEIQHEKMHVEETHAEATDDGHKGTEPPKDFTSASTSVDAEEMEIS